MSECCPQQWVRIANSNATAGRPRRSPPPPPPTAVLLINVTVLATRRRLLLIAIKEPPIPLWQLRPIPATGQPVRVCSTRAGDDGQKGRPAGSVVDLARVITSQSPGDPPGHHASPSDIDALASSEQTMHSEKIIRKVASRRVARARPQLSDK